MHIHHWDKLFAGLFHDFHLAWIGALRDALNGGLLPDSYYALAEQVAGRPHPDVLTLEEVVNDDLPPSMRPPDDDSGVAVALEPPKLRYTVEAEEAIYARKKDRIAIRHVSDDRVVSFIEIISPGNKHSEKEVESFCEKVSQFPEAGKHFLMIDVLPPGKHDPNGMHAAFWEYAFGETAGVTADEPFGCAAYRVDFMKNGAPYPTGYFEPFGRQGPLPEMPLFLTPERYIKVPLDATYATAWNGVPKRWQKVLEATH
jgi:hypothetical protein